MATYNDTRNWDQEELDRARNVAKSNVVSEGASVPQAAKIRSDEVLSSETPSPVLQGERPTTEDERKAMLDNTENAKKNLEKNSRKAKKSRKSK